MNGALKFVIGLIFSCIFFSCSKELSIETSGLPSTTAATGTLKDSTGNCLTITPNGTYYNGVAILGDTDYVQLTVNVTTTGNYSIQSDRQNGFQFSGSGVFNNTGIQTVNLKASGTPSQIQATGFTVSFNNTSCGFTVNVQDSTGHGGSGGTTDTSSITLNQWQFTANGHVYAGNIQSATFTNLIGANLLISGLTASSADTALLLSVGFPGSSIATGTYPTSDPTTNFSLQTISTGNIIFAANATSTQVLNITITSYNSSTKVVSGTFSGMSYDITATSVPITNGKFKATVQ